MAKSNSGLYHMKDKKAQIYKKVTIPNPGGKPTYGYYPIAEAPIWCYTSQLSQELVYEAAHWGNSEVRLFVFNYYAAVAIDQMVLYKNKWYTITRVDTKDDYLGDMFVYVKYSDINPTPQPYDPTKW